MFTVNTLVDEDDGVGVNGVSLRDAIKAANANGQDDSIVFSVTGAILLNSILPSITTKIVIDGPGVGNLTVSGSSARPILFVNGGNLTVADLTLANGRAQGGIGAQDYVTSGGGGAAGMGGALVLNSGTTVIDNVTFSSNQARGGAGGHGGYGNYNPGGGGGGVGANGWILYGGNGGPFGGAGGYNGSAGGPGAGGGGSAGVGGFAGGGGGGNYSYWNGENGAGGGFGGGGGGGGDYNSGIFGDPGWGGTGGSYAGNGGRGGDFNVNSAGGGGGGGAGLGGAVFARAGSLTLLNCQFLTNSATGGAGGLHGWGGGYNGTPGQGRGGAIFINAGVAAYHTGTLYSGNTATSGNPDCLGTLTQLADGGAGPPTVASIVRTSVSPTNVTLLSFTVTFSEDVTGVRADDFDAATTGTLVGEIWSVLPVSLSEYTVVVGGLEGVGTLQLNLVDDDSIEDVVGNALGGSGAGNGDFEGQAYIVDTYPWVASVVRADPDPTTSTSVDFTVTFNEDVVGVDESDFDPVFTGQLGGSVSGVTPVSASTYTVSVSGLSGNGTLRLDVSDDDSIRDTGFSSPLGNAGVGNGDYSAGQVYTVYGGARVTSIARAGATPTSATSVDFTVTFSEPVTGVDVTDFVPTTVGPLLGTVSAVTCADNTKYTVTVSDMSGDGILRLDLVDDDSIRDLELLPLGGPGSGNGDFDAGETYVVDTPPTIASVVLADPSPTSAASVDFTVRFSENVAGVDVGDFALTLSGTATGALSAVAEVNDLTYTVTVGGVGGDGLLRLDLLNNGSIKDFTGNPLVAPAYFIGPAYVIDTPPTVSSIACIDPNPTTATSVNFSVIFTEDVTGVDASDFVLSTTYTATGRIAAVTQRQAPSIYRVTIDNVSGDGLLRLDLHDNDSIRDVSGNALAGAGQGNGNYEDGEAYLVGDPAPYVVSVTLLGDSPTNDASVVFRVDFSEPVTGVDASDFEVTVTGAADGDVGTIVDLGGGAYSVQVDRVTLTAEGTIRLDVLDDDTIEDADTPGLTLGNDGGSDDGEFTDGEAYDIDVTPPVVLSVVRADPDPTDASSVSFTVTFSEGVTNVDVSDFGLTLTDAAGVVAAVAEVSESVYTVTVTGIVADGSGSVGMDVVDDNTIVDAAGNELGGPALGDGDFAGENYTVDTPPSVLSIEEAVAGADYVDFTVTFTESVTGVDVTDFVLQTTQTATGDVTDVVADGPEQNQWTVTVSSVKNTGTIRLDLIDDDSITDLGSNNPLGGVGPGNGDFSDGDVYVVGDPPPIVVSVVRTEANPTNRVTMSFLVTFSEAISGGVDAADFALVKTGTVDCAISGVSSTSASTWEVALDGVVGDGTLRLDVSDNNTILDATGNALGGPALEDGNFTSGEVYDVDMTPPVVSSVAAAGAPAGEGYALFRVTFSEDVTGVDVTDFAPTTGFGPVGTVSSVTQVSPSVYTVKVTGLTGTVTVRLDVIDDDSIHDLATNPLGGGLLRNGDFTSGDEQTVGPELLGEDWLGGCAPGASPGGAGAAAVAWLCVLGWLSLRRRRMGADAA